MKNEDKLKILDFFWKSPEEALFTQKEVSVVLCVSTKTLECARWQGSGIPYRKIGGRVLYRKQDVICFIDSHELIENTSS
jgi:hypothetical protein